MKNFILTLKVAILSIASFATLARSCTKTVRITKHVKPVYKSINRTENITNSELYNNLNMVKHAKTSKGVDKIRTEKGRG